MASKTGGKRRLTGWIRPGAVCYHGAGIGDAGHKWFREGWTG
jgi:hypothetical protein